MPSPWTRFLVAFLCALVLTPVARALAQRLGAIDQPDGKRKIHERPVPLFGGVAVYLSLVVGLWVTTGGIFAAGDELTRLSSVIVVVAGMVCLIGCIDDLWDLPARFKLLLQIAASSIVVLAGYWVDRVVVFGYPIELGYLGIPLTIAWLVGCINALNLLDGMDGLASVVGLTTAIMMALVATISGYPHVAMIALVLAGALAGFLVFNLPPASIYLGDSGSMVIGLVAGILGVQASLKTTATLSITAPAVIMSIPMLDIVLAVVRRKLSGQRFDTADRGHIHHRLLDRGLSNWQALCLIGALCLLMGTAATASTIFHSDALAWITALTLVALMFITRLFGHHELSLVKLTVAQMLAARVGRWAAAHRSSGVVTRRSSLASEPFERVWSQLVDELRHFRVERIELRLDQPHAPSILRHIWRTGTSGENTAITTSPPTELQGRIAGEAVRAETARAMRQWNLAMGFATEAGGRCQIAVSGPESTQPEPVDMLLLSSQLKLYGQHWALQPDDIPWPGAPVGVRPAQVPGSKAA
ncbi:MAG: undecaprenyl/decaprenyl-phosphate alpha-N-acetylglucosaminyl 1-phosphate transferase [Pirellulales bacterium]|nr:undecaprenyl/decaprenyl-phosphate alpha-N-acetylglucosaminyl 1-phosphate transferase [Pirellulales bacterium]